VGHEFDIKPFAGRVAFHGFNLAGGPDPHSTSNSAKIVAFNIVRSSLRHNILSHRILVKFSSCCSK
jgi:hypothetical protein